MGSNRSCGRSAPKIPSIMQMAHRHQGSVLDSEEGIRFRGKTVRLYPPCCEIVGTKLPVRFRNAKNYCPKPLVGRNRFPKVILFFMIVDSGSCADSYRAVLASSDW